MYARGTLREKEKDMTTGQINKAIEFTNELIEELTDIGSEAAVYSSKKHLEVIYEDIQTAEQFVELLELLL